MDKRTNQPCVATIGFFDGVHRGHQFLIEDVKDEAKKSDMASLVITFDRHPRQVLQQSYQPQLLTTLEDKLRLLSMTGIDNVEVLHFTKEMAALTAREFMEKELRDRLNVKKLVIGYDNRFGHNRAEGFEDYVRYGRELGIEVLQARPFELNGVKVSSSVVRAFLNGGEVEMAEKCLGRPFILIGKVVRGFQEGRKMGFPTANLETDQNLLIPADGVYATEVKIDNQVQSSKFLVQSSWLEGMTNIGKRPTFHGTKRTIETNIFDFDKDIYNCQMAVKFLKKVRGERMFGSEEELREQLIKDKEYIKSNE